MRELYLTRAAAGQRQSAPEPGRRKAILVEPRGFVDGARCGL
jgi:hypothetical protein